MPTLTDVNSQLLTGYYNGAGRGRPLVVEPGRRPWGSGCASLTGHSIQTGMYLHGACHPAPPTAGRVVHSAAHSAAEALVVASASAAMRTAAIRVMRAVSYGVGLGADSIPNAP
jgi:hypothetical protein